MVTGADDAVGRQVVMVGLSARTWLVIVGAVLLATALSIALPRFEVQSIPNASGEVLRPPFIVRVDRWTGDVEVITPYYWRDYTPARAPAWLSVLPVFDPVAPVTR